MLRQHVDWQLPRPRCASNQLLDVGPLGGLTSQRRSILSRGSGRRSRGRLLWLGIFVGIGEDNEAVVARGRCWGGLLPPSTPRFTALGLGLLDHLRSQEAVSDGDPCKLKAIFLSQQSVISGGL